MIDELVRDLDSRVRGLRVHFVIADVTFILQNPDDFSFQFGVWHEDLDLLRGRAIAHASKQICDWICNGTHEIQAAASDGPLGAAAAAFFVRSEKGIPNSLKSDLASSSVRAVVTIVTSKPMLRLILSISISGKIVWSGTPSV